MGQITLSEARELLLIDKYSLDTECSTHPSLFSHIADQCAEAGSLSDHAKENLAQVNAKVAEKLRIKANEESAKLTEAKLQESILLDEEHKEAFRNYAAAKLNAEKWTSTKDAFTQKAFMLKDLCGLFYSQYFTKESVNVNPAAVEKETMDVRKKLQEHRKESMSNGRF